MKIKEKAVVEYDITLTQTDAEWLLYFAATGNLGSGVYKAKRLELIESLESMIKREEK